ncbi:hypothetical protein QBC34DRAFT_7643 [Podospora aff. communis PSN243]|uniref:Uncharacterized protein n=1 Tax=Podospora aff. communis PSN243 TaxID=3040156 RepID=A0AAV9H805_9PEZI|nr:hypothetical protein QBC34DRAFT_7643 [Podospora aff. communis PSN243]
MMAIKLKHRRNPNQGHINGSSMAEASICGVGSGAPSLSSFKKTWASALFVLAIHHLRPQQNSRFLSIFSPNNKLPLSRLLRTAKQPNSVLLASRMEAPPCWPSCLATREHISNPLKTPNRQYFLQFLPVVQVGLNGPFAVALVVTAPKLLPSCESYRRYMVVKFWQHEYRNTGFTSAATTPGYWRQLQCMSCSPTSLRWVHTHICSYKHSSLWHAQLPCAPQRNTSARPVKWGRCV